MTTRPLWYITAAGKVVAGKQPPKDAQWFCHEGDEAWTRLDARPLPPKPDPEPQP